MNTPLTIKNLRAFTLVETLVAIAILMISISGPLAVANKALTASLYAKDQSTASFLAQEEMEIIKYTKDNSVAEGSGSLFGLWNGLISGLSSTGSVSGHLDLEMVISTNLPDMAHPLKDSGHLYKDSNGYNHDGNGIPTIFYRYFYLTKIADNEYQATVVVTWYEGTVQNAVTMQSELLNVAP
jgi:hypothetical protein